MSSLYSESIIFSAEPLAPPQQGRVFAAAPPPAVRASAGSVAASGKSHRSSKSRADSAVSYGGNGAVKIKNNHAYPPAPQSLVATSTKPRAHYQPQVEVEAWESATSVGSRPVPYVSGRPVVPTGGAEAKARTAAAFATPVPLVVGQDGVARVSHRPAIPQIGDPAVHQSSRAPSIVSRHTVQQPASVAMGIPHASRAASVISQSKTTVTMREITDSPEEWAGVQLHMLGPGHTVAVLPIGATFEVVDSNGFPVDSVRLANSEQRRLLGLPSEVPAQLATRVRGKRPMSVSTARTSGSHQSSVREHVPGTRRGPGLGEAVHWGLHKALGGK